MLRSSRQAHPHGAASHPEASFGARTEANPPAQRPAAPRADGVSLLWRVFAANVVVFVVAAALLAWTPVTVHRVATPREVVILAIGVILMAACDLWLLRRAFAPLRRLAAVMGEVEPGQPGRRAEAPGRAGREVTALANALNEMLDRLEGERRESTRRAVAAQEDERLRVARELHDEIGQTLTAIALRAERAAERPEGRREALDEINRTVLHSLDDVRRIGRELRPEALDDLGLVNALMVLCTRLDQRDGLRVRSELSWDLPPLSAEAELVIYRVAQEALTNVIRHAHASGVTVALRRTPEGAALVVADDGCGLPEAIRSQGLRGMRERAMLIGAQLELFSEPGGGTEVVLTVPVPGVRR